MSKYIKLLIVLSLFNSVIFSQSITIGKVTNAGGNPVLIPVSVSGSLTNVKSISMQIKYDPASIRFIHDIEDPLSGITGITLPNTANFSVYSENGLITISWFNSTGVSLSGLLFNLEFNYTSGFSEIKFVTSTIKNMLGAKLTYTLQNGCISHTTDPAITVQYPNGSELLEVVGSPTTILWTSVYVNLVKIEYTVDGSTWNTIVSGYNSTLGSYDWTIPTSINSTTCKIRITDMDVGATAIDASDANFTINSIPVLTLLSPNGGEKLKVGEVKRISWSFKNTLNVKLEYSVNASAGTPVLNTITLSVPAKSAYFDWDIPNNISTDCKIKISDPASSTNDLSDAVFSISNPPISVTVGDTVEAHLEKIGKEMGGILGEYYYCESPDYIWKNSLALYNNHGVTYELKDTLIVDGKVPVNISGWMTNLTYLEMKISFNSNVLKFDSLSTVFKEMLPISVSSKDSIIHIIWSGSVPVDIHDKIFDLYFTYKNLTAPEQWLNPTPPQQWSDFLGMHSNPTTPGQGVVLDPRNYSDIKINMVSAVNSENNIIDASSWTKGSLSVNNLPFVKILYPLGGEILEHNDGSANVSWVSRGITNVSLLYSTNNGTNWNDIASLAASTGTYNWAIPNVNSTQCLVKIKDQSASSPVDTSKKIFTITNIDSLNLTSPEGGDILKVGSNKIITWKCRNISNVKLEYTTDFNDSVKVWTVISSSVNAKNYSYTWQVPNTSSVYCRVKISDVLHKSVVDSSSGNFIINNSNVRVSLPTMTSAPLGVVTIPISVDKVNSVTFINFSINYNPANLTLDNVQSSSELASGALGYDVDKTTASPNYILRIVWISSTPVDANGILFNIYFKNFNGLNTPLTFDSPNVMKDQNNQVIPIDYVNGLTDVKTTLLPKTFALLQNYPNPFNPSTTIRFELPKASKVNLSIYNILGQKIATLVDEFKIPGYYQIKWDAKSMANGIYFYSIRTGDNIVTKKMILLK
jgi:hypothetical protein